MTKRPYLTLGKQGRDAIGALGSTFVSYAMPVSSEFEVLEALTHVRTHHADASHHAYAYRLGDTGDVLKWSDDGEPHGSAGGPLKTLLIRRDITNALVVVSRTFGGTKLGKGRLTRTYAAAGRRAVEAAGVVRMVPHTVIIVSTPYEHAAKIEHELRSRPCVVDDVAYGTSVTIRLHCIEGSEGDILNVCSDVPGVDVQMHGTTMRGERSIK